MVSGIGYDLFEGVPICIAWRWLCLSQFRLRFVPRFFHRWLARKAPQRVAEEFGVSVRSVRRLFARFDELGKDGITPDYEQCGANHPDKTPEALRVKVIRVRHEHPTWGAPLVRVMMQREKPRREWPSARTMQRWFRQAGLAPAPAGRRPAGATDRAEQPHQIWQMDAKERMTLASGSPACWLRVVDEFSGAVLQTFAFARGSFTSLGPWVVQDKLRAVFAHW